MERDHPVLVQHSKCHTQGWRANGDISLILSKSDPSNPSVDEILATKNTLQGMPAKCSKLLMNTLKIDISSVDASFELSSIPLFRSSHLFQSTLKEKEPDDLSQEHEVLNSDVPQPEWMEALRPNPNYDNSSLNFTFDDGSPDHDWSDTSHIHPDDLGKDWWTASQVMKIKMKV
uniref:Uncharacterized protein n=1 Tax=Magallana gigas TaxID=29159 RepID=A0A8W8MJ19_MAGGI